MLRVYAFASLTLNLLRRTAGTCKLETGGTCNYLGCNGNRGKTKCIAGHCICNNGTCSLGNSGVCTKGCPSDTGGTCHIFNCWASRGPTKCVRASCQCKEGFCAAGGTCYPKPKEVSESYFLNEGADQ